MIKLAQSIQDIQKVINLLGDFLSDTAYKQGAQAAQNREHLGKIAYTVKNSGYIWLAEKDEPEGLLMATVEPNMWFPQVRQLRELVWYVKPQSRCSVVSGRLFAEFCRKGDELLTQGLIEGYFTTRMGTTSDYNLERRGFRLTESTYLKER
jgi:hypothetical protein